MAVHPTDWVYAHRVAYILTYGPIPENSVIRHKCDNPPCCNPSHLLLGTQGDNVKDRDERGRSRKGKTTVRVAKNREEAARLRQLGFTLAAIGHKLGVSPAGVSYYLRPKHMLAE